MKHAIEHYVKREGASEKDIRQERKVLDDVEDLKSSDKHVLLSLIDEYNWQLEETDE